MPTLAAAISVTLQWLYAHRQLDSEHTFSINVTNYSVLRLNRLAVGYFDLC